LILVSLEITAKVFDYSIAPGTLTMRPSLSLHVLSGEMWGSNRSSCFAIIAQVEIIH